MGEFIHPLKSISCVDDSVPVQQKVVKFNFFEPSEEGFKVSELKAIADTTAEFLKGLSRRPPGSAYALYETGDLSKRRPELLQTGEQILASLLATGLWEREVRATVSLGDGKKLFPGGIKDQEKFESRGAWRLSLRGCNVYSKKGPREVYFVTEAN